VRHADRWARHRRLALDHVPSQHEYDGPERYDGYAHAEIAPGARPSGSLTTPSDRLSAVFAQGRRPSGRIFDIDAGTLAEEARFDGVFVNAKVPSRPRAVQRAHLASGAGS